MNRYIWVFVAIFWARPALTAETWSGFLVDANCFANEERNVGPRDTLIAVDRDLYWEVRQCRPGAKTKAFGIVNQDGEFLRLDPASNSEAAAVAANVDRKSTVRVVVSGEKAANSIRPTSVSARP
jgi:hypothetical protein